MNTAEMLILADKNENTYKTGNMYYRKGEGFTDKEGNNWDIEAFDSFDEFIHTDGWEEVKLKRMTVKEIEKELGYEVEIANK